MVVSTRPTLAADVRAVLRFARADSLWVETPDEAARAMDTTQFDLVVADAVDGNESLYAGLIQARRVDNVPILMLVSASDTAAKCFAHGADDCMKWPASAAELLARVELRASRRSTTSSRAAINGPTTPLEFGAMRIDRQTHVLSMDGEPVHLTPKEFDVLVYLAESPGETFTKEQILRAVWHSTSEFQDVHTVREHVYRLRRKLGAAAPWIATVGRIGYRFLDVNPARSNDSLSTP